MRSPVCKGRHDTVVAAHSDYGSHGKGGGLKSHDIYVVFSCQDCHSWYGTPDQVERKERYEVWREGWFATMVHLVKSGVMTVREITDVLMSLRDYDNAQWFTQEIIRRNIWNSGSA